jgi:hypothetical protein
MSAFNSTKHPTARRQHRCDECNRTIEQGERYSRTAAVWDGDFFTNVACLHCEAARMIVNRSDSYYYETYYGGLGEWLNEMGHEALWSLRLLVGVRARWRYQSGALMPVPEFAS